MSEREIETNFITPAVEKSKWSKKQIRMNVYFTDGKIMIAGKTIKRGRRNFADYILEYKPNVPLAVIEVKDNNHSVGEGMQQGLGYAEKLDLPFVFSSNGDGFVFHDRETGKEVPQRDTDKWRSLYEEWIEFAFDERSE